ncbi:MAG: type II toxin-antitoxin system antitoxin SocA domain-containing protein [Candidatus Paceibacterota bacterium]|jgi:uncharacterized phage-associated protein
MKLVDNLNRLEQLIIFILDRANKKGIKDLSDFQLMKMLYLLEVFSLKYTGAKFIDEVFTRHENGPITTYFYKARENLLAKDFLNVEEKKKVDYKYPRRANMLGKKKLDKFIFSMGETIFLDNFLDDFLKLTQKELKNLAYETEPMKAILESEKNKDIKKGTIIDFNKVIVDPDVVETYSDEL